MNYCGRTAIVLMLAIITGTARAEFTGNIGVTSNYLWRGATKSGDGPAVFGGLDYNHATGLYVGTWTSAIDPHRADEYPPTSDDYDSALVNQDYEWQLYTGYRHGLKQAELDLGYIAYLYPRGNRFNNATKRLEPGTGNQQDFAEIYLGITVQRFNARYWYSDDFRGTDHSLYYFEINLEVPLRNDLLITLHSGYRKGASIRDGEHRVGDFHIALSKGPYQFMVSQMTDNEDVHQSDNLRLAVSWRQVIDL